MYTAASGRRLPAVLASVSLLMMSASLPAAAQSADGAPAQTGASPVPVRDESEQNLVNLPTTQPMHRFGSHVRITHRFARDLRRGSLGELTSDLFGLDEGAVIGFEYRFAPLSNVQVAAYRSMLFRTIQFSGRYDGLRQGDRLPLSASALVSVEGTNNFREDYAPALGAVVSRTYGRRLALYATPTFVWHSITPGIGALTGHEGHDPADLGHLEAPATGTDENTAYVGLGGRVQLLQTAYLTLEYAPRITGFAPGRGTWGAAIEKHTRGHLLQLNVSNSFGTTYGQLARGGERSNVYLGFNIARKF